MEEPLSILNLKSNRPHLKGCHLYMPTYLDGYFGAHSSCKLVYDLGIQTASVVHISDHDWE